MLLITSDLIDMFCPWLSFDLQRIALHSYTWVHAVWLSCLLFQQFDCSDSNLYHTGEPDGEKWQTGRWVGVYLKQKTCGEMEGASKTWEKSPAKRGSLIQAYLEAWKMGSGSPTNKQTKNPPGREGRRSVLQHLGREWAPAQADAKMSEKGLLITSEVYSGCSVGLAWWETHARTRSERGKDCAKAVYRK